MDFNNGGNVRMCKIYMQREMNGTRSNLPPVSSNGSQVYSFHLVVLSETEFDHNLSKCHKNWDI